MLNYNNATREQLKQEYEKNLKAFEESKSQNLKLNMARGKPAKMQLDAVSDILTVLTDADECICDGIDTRNYGELTGIPCARAYWADVLGCKPEQTFVGGTASLNFMFDVIARAFRTDFYIVSAPGARKKPLSSCAPAPVMTGISASPSFSARN